MLVDDAKSLDCRAFVPDKLIGLHSQKVTGGLERDSLVAIETPKYPDGKHYFLGGYRACGKSVLTLEQFTSVTSPDPVILSAIEEPASKPKEMLMLGGCQLDGKNNDEVFAFTSPPAVAHALPVTRAWRANRQAGKIETVDVKNVRCLDTD